jgi:hypothetical protein
MTDDTYNHGSNTSFLENRKEMNKYLEKDKSLAVKNDLQVTKTEERVTNNRLIMNIAFHIIIFICSSIMTWIKVKLFLLREAYENHDNIIYFSLMHFKFYKRETNEFFTFPYQCAFVQIDGDVRKCLLQEHCNIYNLANIFEFFKFEICNEFSTIKFFGIIVIFNNPVVYDFAILWEYFGFRKRVDYFVITYEKNKFKKLREMDSKEYLTIVFYKIRDDFLFIWVFGLLLLYYNYLPRIKIYMDRSFAYIYNGWLDWELFTSSEFVL